LFHGEVGITPAARIEQARVSAVRRLLELGREAPKQVALRCGFANADTLRRAFVRHMRCIPPDGRLFVELPAAPSGPPAAMRPCG
jgi:transcriptional regulator GlxA family with amidase domain